MGTFDKIIRAPAFSLESMSYIYKYASILYLIKSERIDHVTTPEACLILNMN